MCGADGTGLKQGREEKKARQLKFQRALLRWRLCSALTLFGVSNPSQSKCKLVIRRFNQNKTCFVYLSEVAVTNDLYLYALSVVRLSKGSAPMYREPPFLVAQIHSTNSNHSCTCHSLHHSNTSHHNVNHYQLIVLTITLRRRFLCRVSPNCTALGKSIWYSSQSMFLGSCFVWF